MKRPLCLFCLAILAAVWIILELFPISPYECVYDGQNQTLVGKVYRKEVKKDFNGNLIPVIYINSLEDSNINIQCYMDADSYVEPVIDSYVQITGKCKSFKKATNPGEFDSRKYYQILKISYRMQSARILAISKDGNPYKEAMYKISRYCARILDDNLNAHDAGVMKAILIGDKSTMDEDITELYKKGNIISIIAVSGLHISILGMGLYKLLRKLRLPNSVAILICIAVMWSYGIICGMGTSAFRAIIMFGIKLAGKLLGRTYDMMTAMSIAAVMVLIEQPLYIYHSGFLMSFGAIISLAMILPELEPICSGDYKELMYEEKDGLEYNIRNYFQNVFNRIKSSLLSSLAIWIVTLPVYMSFYYSLMIYSPVINLIIFPLVPVLILCGIVVIIAGSVLYLITMAGSTVLIYLGAIPEGIAEIIKTFFAGVIHIILAMYDLCCSGSQNLPGNTWYTGHAEKWQLIIYIVMVGIFVCGSSYVRDVVRYKIRGDMDKIKGSNKEKGNNRKSRGSKDKRVICYRNISSIRYQIHKILLAIDSDKKKFDIARYLWLLFAVVLLSLRFHPDLKVTAIDVGQGDGIVIESRGMNYMIDGGSTSKRGLNKYQLTPFLLYEGIGRLDGIILTHEDEDHLSGIMELLEEIPNGGIKVDNLILPDVDESSKGENYRALVEKAQEVGVPVSYVSRGQQIRVGKAMMTCLAPKKSMHTDEPNAYSTVMMLKCNDFKMLLTGDVDGIGQMELTNFLEDNRELAENLTVLKVAHHGSRYTTDEHFLDICRPLVSVISCGENNKYGHPHEELLKRLSNIGSRTYITKDIGAITITYSHGRVYIEGFVQ